MLPIAFIQLVIHWQKKGCQKKLVYVLVEMSFTEKRFEINGPINRMRGIVVSNQTKPTGVIQYFLYMHTYTYKSD